MKTVYISGWRDKGERTGMTTPVEVFFTFKPEEAHSWPSEERANHERANFDSYGVKVNWTENGEAFTCKFKVEKLSPLAFVLFCDGPFIFKATGYKNSAAAS